MLPADTHIGGATLRVASLERSLAFYRNLLGLRAVREEAGRVDLAAPGEGARELIALRETPGVVRRPARPRTAGLYHVALLVPSRRDLGRTFTGLAEAGYPLRGMSDHAVSESLYLDDPDGNGLEIYRDRPCNEWPRRGDQIVMTIDPLDLDAVRAAGQERPEPWTGLPAGTVIGHVHFTVSDLEAADAFYRHAVGLDATGRLPLLWAYSAGGYHHHVNINQWAGAGAPGDSEQVAGLDEWELVVPDADARVALTQRLAAAAPAFADPDGNRIAVAAA